MTPHFDDILTPAEKALFATLDSPFAIQTFLDTVPYSTDHFYRCPLRVLRDRRAHCFDGALFAAACLRRIGFRPLIIELLPNDRDDDHLLAVFRIDGCWGAVAKSNFVGLRYREPVYRGLRELVMSYFEPYYNIAREKTLRGYTYPLDLSAFDAQGWMTADEPLDRIADRLDTVRRSSIVTDAQVARLSLLDERSFKAGSLGMDMDGVFKV